MFYKTFVNLKELLESMEYLMTLSTKYQRRYPIELFFYLSKRPQKEKYNLKESYYDFLIYYNDREHSNTMATPFRAMMNILKICFRRYREHLKEDIRRRYYRRVLKNSIERVFNLIRFSDKNHIRFNPPRDYKNMKAKRSGLL